MPWPYVTFADAAAKVGGSKRLVTEIMDGHADESASSHPFFDEMSDQASREADIALESAGYATPLETVNDPKFHGAVMNWLFHLLSETSTSREKWIDEARDSARAYFDSLAARQITLVGVEPTGDDLRDDGIFGQFDEQPQFQLGDPYAGINDVYADLGRPGRRWRW